MERAEALARIKARNAKRATPAARLALARDLARSLAAAAPSDRKPGGR